jgi:hypothetical protein
MNLFAMMFCHAARVLAASGACSECLCRPDPCNVIHSSVCLLGITNISRLNFLSLTNFAQVDSTTTVIRPKSV